MLLLKKIIFLAFNFVIAFSNLIFAREDDGESMYGYRNGLYGCGCFKHCNCFSHYKGNYPGAFPEDNIYHPKDPEDKAWHAFMQGILSAKKIGPYHDWTERSFSNFISRPELITEYLDKIDSFYLLIESDRVEKVNFYCALYKSPKEESKKNSIINEINNQAIAANHKLDETIENVMFFYEQILNSCPHQEEYNMALYYNKGMIDLLKGNSIGAMDSIERLIESVKKNDRLNPLDEAIADYNFSEKKKDLAKIQHKTTSEFRDALLKGLIKHTAEGIMEFIPSLAHSAYGLTNAAWSLIEHPLDTSVNFANVCYETGQNITEFLSTIDMETIESNALKLYQSYDKLGEAEKGDLIAYTLGKCGVDVFAGSTALKCISSIKKLKEANAACNLEALAKTEGTKQIIISNALIYRAERQTFFSNAKIQWDRQNKHIKSKHNFEANRGIITLETIEIEALLKQYAGTGQKIIGEFGVQGYKERIDFGRIIGEYALKTEGKPVQYYSTTRGIITYAKDGKAHIYPSHPNSR
jgi:hypothetical protein